MSFIINNLYGLYLKAYYKFIHWAELGNQETVALRMNYYKYTDNLSVKPYKF
jgi:hypothetical protein